MRRMVGLMFDIQNDVLDTLFYPVQSGGVDTGESVVLFLNAQYHDALLDMMPEKAELDEDDEEPESFVICQQGFKPYADRLSAKGIPNSPAYPEQGAYFDIVFAALPKNQIESMSMIAQALRFLKPGGQLCVAAHNKAGGGRIVKNLEQFGIADIHNETRNRCRVVWAQVDEFDEAAFDAALLAGGMQPVLDGAFQSRPGVFGWNKIDQGSQILLQHLPANITGEVADFGCGYGYLSKALAAHEDIKTLHLIDADFFALHACQENLKGIKKPEAVEHIFHWLDLAGRSSHENDIPRDLDSIVMNPPFHEGKTTDTAIGHAFIRNAAESLKQGGQLWMVANKQLPYEDVLKQNFSSMEKVFEGQGFKVFCATR